MELLGTVGAFPSLETLSFKHMNGWETWSMNSEDVFPCLKQLYVKDCPNLVEVELKALPLLNVLEIRRCDGGVLRRLVEIASAVTKLEIESISGLNDAAWRGVIECLRTVEELSIYWCNEIRYLWESEAVASKVLVNLRKLEVFGCDNLVRLGEKEDDDDCRSNLLTSLRMLDVSSCKNMERCSCPDSIETLRVFECPSVTSIFLPMGGQKLKSLDIWGCKKLLETEWKGENMSMLEYVSISEWANLKLIIKLNYLVHLNTLSIENCESVESFPWNELLNLTSLKKLGITNCPRMDVCGIWPPNLRSLTIGKLKNPISEWGPQSFPTSLVKLYLDGDHCSEFSHLLPSSLTFLHIFGFEKLESFSMGLQHLTSLQNLQFDNCPNMKKVSHPQHLTSLQHLSFYHCPEMMDLPDVLFPSLLSLTIVDCPKLKERYSKGGGCWPLIYHIPGIRI